MASFRLAVERDFKDTASGERITDWIDVTAWSYTGEFVSRYFTKGRMAVVSGRLQMRDWTDKNGIKRTSAEIVADSVYWGDSRREVDGQSAAAQAPGYQTPAYQPQQDFIELPDDGSGDLPF